MSKRKVISKNAKELAVAMGMDASAAVEWEMRHSLTQKIIDTVKKNRFPVTLVASRSKTSRARVTRILKGDSQGISIDVLLRMLGAVGQKVKVTFRKAA